MKSPFYTEFLEVGNLRTGSDEVSSLTPRIDYVTIWFKTRTEIEHRPHNNIHEKSDKVPRVRSTKRNPYYVLP